MTPADLRHALGSLCVDAPDGLYASPRSARQLAEVLAVLRAHGAALGREVKLSRGAFDRLEGVEPRSCTAVAGAGMQLSALESALNGHAMTLGHLSPGALKLTLGEVLEGPYAGLRAIAGGRLEPLCLSLEAVLADGHILRTHDSPRSAAGPELMALVLGGRGRLALTISARVRCYPVFDTRKTVRLSYPSVEAAIDAVKGALADGCVFGAIRAQQVGSRPMLEFGLGGPVDAVERDAATLSRHAPALGGRPAGEAPESVPADAAEAEATWSDIARALLGATPLELHRLSLSTALVRGGPAPVPNAAWPDPGLLAAFDPAGVLGGAP